MQVEIPATFSGLDLSDPVALFDQTPADVDGAAIRQALSTALSRVPESEATPKPVWRLRVLAEAGRVLLAEAALASAIHLTQTAAAELADAAPLAHVRLIALWRKGDRGGVIAEADRVLAQTTHSPPHRKAIRDLLRQWNIERLLPPRIEHLEDFWADVESAIRDPFAAVSSDGPYPFTERVAPAILSIRGLPADQGYFLEQLKWGAALHRSILFTRLLCASIRTKPSEERTPAEVNALAIHQSVSLRLRPSDMSSVFAEIEAGRSAVITSAHAGLSVLAPGLQVGNVPFSAIGNVVGPATRPDDFHISTSGPNVALEFTKLGKLLRKSPRIVRIFPDGAYGETSEISVYGKRVLIGRGAASLAYIGKAATFFSYSRRDGDHIAFPIRQGPIASDYTQKDDFENDFLTFYAACLEEIIKGNPEDMAPLGCFWQYMTD